MKNNKNIPQAEEKIMQSYADHHIVEQKGELMNKSNQNVVMQITERYERIKPDHESKKDGDIRFALDKVSTNTSAGIHTAGNIEIGPLNSAL